MAGGQKKRERHIAPPVFFVISFQIIAVSVQISVSVQIAASVQISLPVQRCRPQALLLNTVQRPFRAFACDCGRSEAQLIIYQDHMDPSRML